MLDPTGIDLKGLQAFLAVVEHKTVRKAADRLDMVPSAVSQSLAGLEAQLGVDLFDRERRPMRLTPAGRRLVQDGSRLLEEIRRVRARVCSETLSMQQLRLGRRVLVYIFFDGIHSCRYLYINIDVVENISLATSVICWAVTAATLR